MSDNNSYDLIIIGAGPGGYVAAIRAAQLGMSVACVEKEDKLGGTCLRVGCIPSKALLESSEKYHETQKALKEHGVRIDGVSLDLKKMMRRKDSVVRALTTGVASLFKKNGVESVTGAARFDSPGKIVVESDDGERTLEAKNILIATGSAPATIPGVEFDGDRIGGSAEALSYPEAPERLVVIGGGYIGLELGSVWSRLGSEVTVLEFLDRILPYTDAELASEALKLFRKQGLDIQLGTKVTGASADGEKVKIEREGGDPIECDRVLVAVGRRPCADGLNLEAIGIEPNDKGFIPVDENFATSAKGVYAIGDVIGGLMLAHKAEEEGMACVEKIAGRGAHINYDAIPSIVYTHPEIASVGRTEEQLVDEGVEFKKGVFPFRANGRARSLGQVEGFVKTLADAKTDRLLAVHIIGPRAGDLIAEAATAMEFGASAEDLARCTHAHPTLSEALKESALAVGGRAIHI